MDEDYFQTKITDHMSYENYIDGEKAKAQEENGFMTAFRLSGEAKCKGIRDFIETLIENNCKFLIFAHHISVMDNIEQYVQSQKVGYIRIDGSTQVETRHNRVRDFQNFDNIRVAILSINACS